MSEEAPKHESPSVISPIENEEKGLAPKPLERVPPNGGAKAWACVAGSFLLQFCSFGYVNAYVSILFSSLFVSFEKQPTDLPENRCGIFQLYYQETMLKDQTSSALAWITTLQIFLLFMFGPAVGKMIDVYGCRRTLPPFSIGAVFSVCMLSLCTKYWQVMLAQGVAFGLAAAGLSLPAMATATQWFSTKKGLAVGIVSAGSSLGKNGEPLQPNSHLDG
jgi:MCP family monocarboxylic acid transporter-like MFS transporter 10